MSCPNFDGLLDEPLELALGDSPCPNCGEDRIPGPGPCSEACRIILGHDRDESAVAWEYTEADRLAEAEVEAIFCDERRREIGDDWARDAARERDESDDNVCCVDGDDREVA